MRANNTVIKALRERSGLSSAHVARTTGIDPTHYWRIENGKRNGTPAQLKAIAEALGVPVVAITFPVEERKAS